MFGWLLLSLIGNGSTVAANADLGPPLQMGGADASSSVVTFKNNI
jgi:hypothetical protein